MTLRPRPVHLASGVALLSALLLAACTGPEGPPGRDAAGVDAVPPTVDLVYPLAGDTLSDTLEVLARALDNVGGAQGVSRVVFYFDGSDRINDSTVAWDESPEENALFRSTFILSALGVRPGLHTVSARAYDLSDNIGSTPAVIVHYPGLPDTGHVALRYWSPDTLALWSFPKRSLDGVVQDSLYNVRFEAKRRCRLDSVRFFLDTLAHVEAAWDSPLEVSLWHSNGAFPTRRLASQRLPNANLNRTGWYTVQFEGEFTFEAGERFHVAVTAEDPSEGTLMALRYTPGDPAPLAIDNHSGFFSADSSFNRFVTLQEWTAEQDSITVPYAGEFLIEAYVFYFYGGSASGAPGKMETIPPR